MFLLMWLNVAMIPPGVYLFGVSMNEDPTRDLLTRSELWRGKGLRD